MRTAIRLVGLPLLVVGIGVSPLMGQDSLAARNSAGVGPSGSRPALPERADRPGSPAAKTTYVLQTIAARQFIATDSSQTWSDDGNGGLYRTGGISVWFDAAVDIPAGSRLDYLEIEGCNENVVQNMYAWFFDMASPMGTIALYPADGVNVAPSSGCGFFQNPTAFGLTIDRKNNTQLVRIRLDATDTSNRFRAVRLYYTPQVSPAPATATFNDVPTDHPFFQFVQALSTAGITAGCQASPPLYCPDNPVTRGQMAVFLSKLVGLYWPY